MKNNLILWIFLSMATGLLGSNFDVIDMEGALTIDEALAFSNPVEKAVAFIRIRNKPPYAEFQELFAELDERKTTLDGILVCGEVARFKETLQSLVQARYNLCVYWARMLLKEPKNAVNSSEVNECLEELKVSASYIDSNNAAAHVVKRDEAKHLEAMTALKDDLRQLISDLKIRAEFWVKQGDRFAHFKEAGAERLPSLAPKTESKKIPVSTDDNNGKSKMDDDDSESLDDILAKLSALLAQAQEIYVSTFKRDGAHKIDDASSSDNGSTDDPHQVNGYFFRLIEELTFNELRSNTSTGGAAEHRVETFTDEYQAGLHKAELRSEIMARQIHVQADFYSQMMRNIEQRAELLQDKLSDSSQVQTTFKQDRDLLRLLSIKLKKHDGKKLTKKEALFLSKREAQD